MLLRGIRGMGYASAGVYNPYMTAPPPGAPPAAPPAGAPPAAPAAPAVIYGSPPAVLTRVVGAAVAAGQMLPTTGGYYVPPPPAPVPPVSVTLGPSLSATGPAVPVGGSVTGVGLGSTKGPNELALDAAMAAAGVTTNDQAAAWLSSLDGQPAPQFLDESSSAYYLAILQKKQQEATYLKWGIAGAGILGIALLFK